MNPVIIMLILVSVPERLPSRFDTIRYECSQLSKEHDGLRCGVIDRMEDLGSVLLLRCYSNKQLRAETLVNGIIGRFCALRGNEVFMAVGKQEQSLTCPNRRQPRPMWTELDPDPFFKQAWDWMDTSWTAKECLVRGKRFKSDEDIEEQNKGENQ